jgi:hypothetical protein
MADNIISKGEREKKRELEQVHILGEKKNVV